MKKLILLMFLSCFIVHGAAALINVSTGKTAAASSLWGGTSANMATDGVTAAAAMPIFHTATGDYTPWLRIDLNKVELIKKFTLWNRVDCCWGRLRDIKIEILDENMNVVFTSVMNPGNILGITNYTIPSIDLTLDNSVPGQYVRVSRIAANQTNEDGYVLCLNEVQVFADGQTSSVASKPSPYDGEINVPVSVTLSWDASLLDDPNTPEPPYQNPNLIRHELYLSSGNPADPNVVHKATIPAGAARIGYGPIAINRDGVYYWRVDEIIPDPNNPAVEKTITGVKWKFNAVPSLPVIDPAAPVAQFITLGTQAEFIVSAINPFTGDTANLNYAWYKSADNANNTDGDDVAVGTNSSTLTINNAQPSDQGYYYCRVTNVEAGTSRSKTAMLAIKLEMARYKFDAATDTTGSYTDAMGNYNAAMLNPTYTRNYVAGMDGDAIMMDSSSVANAGTWDPSALTNQLTITCWVKWNGLLGAGTYQGIAGKADSWATAHKWMWRTDNNAAAIRWFKNPTIGPILTLTNDGKWQFLCITVANGTASGYVNGIRIGSSAWTFGTGDTAPIYIGMAENNVTRYFNGAIDDLRIYNYAFSYENIVDEYNARVDPDIVACITAVDTVTDINKDCKINILDLIEFVSGWMNCGLYPLSACN